MIKLESNHLNSAKQIQLTMPIFLKTLAQLKVNRNSFSLFFEDFWGFNRRNPFFDFENMFAKTSTTSFSPRGTDILIELEISFLESVNGTYRNVSFEKH